MPGIASSSTPTMMAPTPNHNAVKLGRKISTAISAMPNASQYQ